MNTWTWLWAADFVCMVVNMVTCMDSWTPTQYKNAMNILSPLSVWVVSLPSLSSVSILSASRRFVPVVLNALRIAVHVGASLFFSHTESISVKQLLRSSLCFTLIASRSGTAIPSSTPSRNHSTLTSHNLFLSSRRCETELN